MDGGGDLTTVVLAPPLGYTPLHRSDRTPPMPFVLAPFAVVPLAIVEFTLNTFGVDQANQRAVPLYLGRTSE